MNDIQDNNPRLAELKTEHRKLDEEIALRSSSGTRDQIYLQRLKKKKLSLRDEISKIENNLLPDIIA